jgi:hypothetical protein
VIAQESASTPRWRTRRPSFRDYSFYDLADLNSEIWLCFASNGDWRLAIAPRFFHCACGLRRKGRFPTLPPKLFGLLGPLTLAKADAQPTPVLVDELNSCFLESGLDFFSGYLSPPKPALGRFQAFYRWKGDFSSRR